jgi:tryptophan aminotransferase
MNNMRDRLCLAKTYNFLIFEDDAYYFLDFADNDDSVGSTPTRKSSSYLALEAQANGNQTGRVLRFDSISKIVSAGLRVGFLTASLPALKMVNVITGNTK